MENSNNGFQGGNRNDNQNDQETNGGMQNTGNAYSGSGELNRPGQEDSQENYNNEEAGTSTSANETDYNSYENDEEDEDNDEDQDADENEDDEQSNLI